MKSNFADVGAVAVAIVVVQHQTFVFGDEFNAVLLVSEVVGFVGLPTDERRVFKVVQPVRIAPLEITFASSV